MYATNGKNYSIGSSSEVMYLTSGNSKDYAKGELEIPYVYTIELRPKDDVPIRFPAEPFLLPPKEIIPCAKEIVAFHVAAAQQIIEEFST